MLYNPAPMLLFALKLVYYAADGIRGTSFAYKIARGAGIQDRSWRLCKPPMRLGAHQAAPEGESACGVYERQQVLGKRRRSSRSDA